MDASLLCVVGSTIKQALRGESASEFSTVTSSVAVIGLNYAQGTALLAGFNLDWGSSVRAVFAALNVASGAVADSTRQVIRTADAWAQAWSQATSSLSNPPSRPAINFGSAMAVLVSAGRMTPEDRIRVDSVGVRRERTAEGEMEETFVVLVRTQVGCGRLRVDAYPVEIVRVPRFEGNVRFVERRDQAENCGGAERR